MHFLLLCTEVMILQLLLLYTEVTVLQLKQYKCKVQPRRALLSYPFCNTAAHTKATPTREGI